MPVNACGQAPPIPSLPLAALDPLRVPTSAAHSHAYSRDSSFVSHALQDPPSPAVSPNAASTPVKTPAAGRNIPKSPSSASPSLCNCTGRPTLSRSASLSSATASRCPLSAAKRNLPASEPSVHESPRKRHTQAQTLTLLRRSHSLGTPAELHSPDGAFAAQPGPRDGACAAVHSTSPPAHATGFSAIDRPLNQQPRGQGGELHETLSLPVFGLAGGTEQPGGRAEGHFGREHREKWSSRGGSGRGAACEHDNGHAGSGGPAVRSGAASNGMLNAHTRTQSPKMRAASNAIKAGLSSLTSTHQLLKNFHSCLVVHLKGQSSKPWPPQVASGEWLQGQTQRSEPNGPGAARHALDPALQVHMQQAHFERRRGEEAPSPHAQDPWLQGASGQEHPHVGKPADTAGPPSDFAFGAVSERVAPTPAIGLGGAPDASPQAAGSAAAARSVARQLFPDAAPVQSAEGGSGLGLGAQAFAPAGGRAGVAVPAHAGLAAAAGHGGKAPALGAEFAAGGNSVGLGALDRLLQEAERQKAAALAVLQQASEELPDDVLSGLLSGPGLEGGSTPGSGESLGSSGLQWAAAWLQGLAVEQSGSGKSAAEGRVPTGGTSDAASAQAVGSSRLSTHVVASDSTAHAANVATGVSLRQWHGVPRASDGGDCTAPTEWGVATESGKREGVEHVGSQSHCRVEDFGQRAGGWPAQHCEHRPATDKFGVFQPQQSLQRTRSDPCGDCSSGFHSENVSYAANGGMDGMSGSQRGGGGGGGGAHEVSTAAVGAAADVEGLRALLREWKDRGLEGEPPARLRKMSQWEHLIDDAADELERLDRSSCGKREELVELEAQAAGARAHLSALIQERAHAETEVAQLRSRRSEERRAAEAEGARAAELREGAAELRVQLQAGREERALLESGLEGLREAREEQATLLRGLEDVAREQHAKLKKTERELVDTQKELEVASNELLQSRAELAEAQAAADALHAAAAAHLSLQLSGPRQAGPSELVHAASQTSHGDSGVRTRPTSAQGVRDGAGVTRAQVDAAAAGSRRDGVTTAHRPAADDPELFNEDVALQRFSPMDAVDAPPPPAAPPTALHPDARFGHGPHVSIAHAAIQVCLMRSCRDASAQTAGGRAVTSCRDAESQTEATAVGEPAGHGRNGAACLARWEGDADSAALGALGLLNRENVGVQVGALLEGLDNETDFDADVAAVRALLAGSYLDDDDGGDVREALSGAAAADRTALDDELQAAFLEHSTRLRELELSCAARALELESTSAQVQLHLQQQTELKRACAAARADLDRLTAAADHQQHQAAAAAAECARAQDQQDSAAVKVRAAQEECERVQRAAAAAAAECASAQAEHEAAAVLVRKAQEELEQLRREAAIVDAECESAKGERDAAVARKRAVEGEVQQLRSEATAAAANAATSEGDCARMEAQLCQMREQLEALQADTAAAQRERGEAAAQLQARRQECERLQKAAVAATTEWDEVASKVREARGTVSGLETESVAARQEHGHIVAQLHEAASRLDSLRLEATSTAERLAELREQETAAAAAAREAKAERDRMRLEVVEAASERGSALRERDEACAKAGESRQEWELLRGQAAEAAAELKRLQQELADERGCVETIHQEKQAVVEDVEKQTRAQEELRAEWASVREELDELQEQVHLAEQRRVELEEDCERVAAQLESARAEASAKDEYLQELKANGARAQAEILEIQARVHAAETMDTELRHDCDTALARLEGVQKEVEAQEKLLAELRSESAREQAVLLDVQGQVHSTETAQARLDRKAEVLREEVQKQEGELAELRGRCAHLRGELDEARAAVQREHEVLLEARRAGQRTQMDLEELLEQEAVLSRRVEAQSERAASMSGGEVDDDTPLAFNPELAALAERVAELQRREGELNACVAAAEQERADAEQKAEEAQARVHLLSSELVTLESACERATADVSAPALNFESLAPVTSDSSPAAAPAGTPDSLNSANPTLQPSLSAPEAALHVASRALSPATCHGLQQPEGLQHGSVRSARSSPCLPADNSPRALAAAVSFESTADTVIVQGVGVTAAARGDEVRRAAAVGCQAHVTHATTATQTDVGRQQPHSEGAAAVRGDSVDAAVQACWDAERVPASCAAESATAGVCEPGESRDAVQERPQALSDAQRQSRWLAHDTLPPEQRVSLHPLDGCEASIEVDGEERPVPSDVSTAAAQYERPADGGAAGRVPQASADGAGGPSNAELGHGAECTAGAAAVGSGTEQTAASSEALCEAEGAVQQSGPCATHRGQQTVSATSHSYACVSVPSQHTQSDIEPSPTTATERELASCQAQLANSKRELTECHARLEQLQQCEQELAACRDDLSRAQCHLASQGGAWDWLQECKQELLDCRAALAGAHRDASGRFSTSGHNNEDKTRVRSDPQDSMDLQLAGAQMEVEAVRRELERLHRQLEQCEAELAESKADAAGKQVAMEEMWRLCREAELQNAAVLQELMARWPTEGSSGGASSQAVSEAGSSGAAAAGAGDSEVHKRAGSAALPASQSSWSQACQEAGPLPVQQVAADSRPPVSLSRATQTAAVLCLPPAAIDGVRGELQPCEATEAPGEGSDDGAEATTLPGGTFILILQLIGEAHCLCKSKRITTSFRKILVATTQALVNASTDPVERRPDTSSASMTHNGLQTPLPSFPQPAHTPARASTAFHMGGTEERGAHPSPRVTITGAVPGPWRSAAAGAVDAGAPVALCVQQAREHVVHLNAVVEMCALESLSLRAAAAELHVQLLQASAAWASAVRVADDGLPLQPHVGHSTAAAAEPEGGDGEQVCRAGGGRCRCKDVAVVLDTLTQLAWHAAALRVGRGATGPAAGAEPVLPDAADTTIVRVYHTTRTLRESSRESMHHACKLLEAAAERHEDVSAVSGRAGPKQPAVAFAGSSFSHEVQRYSCQSRGRASAAAAAVGCGGSPACGPGSAGGVHEPAVLAQEQCRQSCGQMQAAMKHARTLALEKVRAAYTQALSQRGEQPGGCAAMDLER